MKRTTQWLAMLVTGSLGFALCGCGTRDTAGTSLLGRGIVAAFDAVRQNMYLRDSGIFSQRLYQMKPVLVQCSPTRRIGRDDSEAQSALGGVRSGIHEILFRLLRAVSAVTTANKVKLAKIFTVTALSRSTIRNRPTANLTAPITNDV